MESLFLRFSLDFPLAFDKPLQGKPRITSMALAFNASAAATKDFAHFLSICLTFSLCSLSRHMDCSQACKEIDESDVDLRALTNCLTWGYYDFLG